MKHKSTFVYCIILLIGFAGYVLDLELDANLLLPIKAVIGVVAVKLSVEIIKNILILLIQIFAIGCIVASVVLLVYS